MLSPFADKIIDSATQNKRLISNGTMTVNLERCINNSTLASDTLFTVVVPTDSAGTSLQGASGITITSTALPDAIITKNTGSACTQISTSYSGGLTSILFNHPLKSNCTYSVRFPLSLTMHSGNGLIAGTVGVDLTSRSPLNGGNGWALYSGSANSFMGLSKSLTLISTTCTLSTNNVTVTLPKISISALGGAGATAGRTPFTLALAGCSNLGSAYSVVANWSFVEGAAGATTIANSAASAASNVYVQLLDSGFVPIGNGGTSNLATVSASGSYQIQHYAQYFAGGTVGAGIVKGVATLTLSYE
jgi:major type 1 subunit fimbrin (pilin)